MKPARQPALTAVPAMALLPDEDPGAGNPSISCLVVDQDLRVALGHAHVPARPYPGQELQVLLLPLQDADVNVLRGADKPQPTWPALSAAALVLDSYLPTGRAVAKVLGKRAIEITRMLQYGKASPALQQAVGRGQITATHARLITKLPAADQPEWVARAIAGAWPVRRLASEIEGAFAGVSASPDMESFERVLSEVLGAHVQLSWPDPPGRRELRVEFHGIEEAKGVMERLAAGPERSGPAANQKRSLTIPIADLGDLDALTEHLTRGRF